MQYIVRQPGCLILSRSGQAFVTVCEFKDQAQDLAHSGLLGPGHLIVEEVTEGELRTRLETARALGCQYVALNPDPEEVRAIGHFPLTNITECLPEGW